MLFRSTYEIIEFAKNISRQTDGAYEATIASITDIWQIGTENAHVPSQIEISFALESVNFENIVLGQDNQVMLLNGAKLDLGGIGKGYAADKIVEIFQKHDIKDGLISLGGNVYAVGEKAKNKGWNVGIASPENIFQTLGFVNVTDQAVVTTGDYERFFEQDGVRYHHVFDGTTGNPANTGLQSVTILCQSSSKADALSTDRKSTRLNSSHIQK